MRFVGILVVLAMSLPPVASAAVSPQKTGELDCNGFSPAQKATRRTLECKDPRVLTGQRFFDNGHYIGHDEPSVRLLSDAPGSASDITVVERLPKEPAALPTVRRPGHDVTHSFELTVAPWFSTSLCDPNSFPQAPCKPESDSNAPSATSVGGGAAFLELQFYAPGFAPFIDGISCDNQHWCSAMAIDSLECDAAGNCNNDCVEPANFAFVQTDGTPPGPPSPQEADVSTFTPNRDTLRMNPGDTIVVRIFNARLPGGGHALETRLSDLTTRTSGYMVASAANGFMTTSMADCSGTPFNFQPEYSSAAPQNVLPWGIGPYNVNTQFEIGHFEPCTSLSGKQVQDFGTFTDLTYLHCHGPYEVGAETDDEPTDAPCYPAGDTHGGLAPPDLVTGCAVFNDAIGDLDFDGTSYWPDWPTSTQPGQFPGSFAQVPLSRGRPYPKLQFVTTVSASEEDCDLTTGAGCAMPPQGPGSFYPYWTQAWDRDLGCTWQFGNVGSGNTFGGDAQYGVVNPTTMGGFASKIMRNPNCGPE
jgi:hypothetical protein